MFNYYSGSKAAQFTFLSVPKFLITNKKFSELSDSTKLLYSLMLDRTSLSIKNGWLDDKNRVYIIYTLEEAQLNMNCGHDKCTKMFAELEKIGLIERKKRGMGRPALIYVKEYVEDMQEKTDDNKTSDIMTSEKQQAVLRENGIQEYIGTEVRNAENSPFSVQDNRGQDFRKTDIINTDHIKTDENKTDLNQSYQSCLISRGINLSEKMDRQDWIQIIKKNIDYDIFKINYSGFEELIDEITEIIVDVVMGQRHVRVDGKTVPEQNSVSKFMQLRYEHVEYVIASIANLKNEIAKPDVYICTALYNATYTLNITSYSGFTAGTGMSLSNSVKSQGRIN
ncbi:MAG: replication initiator protein A [Oscillospiraceae bacterium]|nr:replication initiator protein A [Oscillospiraceae bacterium]